MYQPTSSVFQCNICHAFGFASLEQLTNHQHNSGCRNNAIQQFFSPITHEEASESNDTIMDEAQSMITGMNKQLNTLHQIHQKLYILTNLLKPCDKNRRLHP